MFGINFSEILLIFVIALIAFGPKQIPTLATQIGKVILAIKHHLQTVKQEIYQQSGLNQLTNVKQDLINTYTNIRNNISVSKPLDRPMVFTLCHEEEIFYQPELEFERQPELFDEPYESRTC